MPKKILVVDDDRDLVDIIQALLEKNGYEVMTANDGAKALEMIKTQVPDLMIVDLTMPVLGGWHFTAKVRQDPRYQTTPIIVLSGLLEGDSDAEKFEFASAYMVKPFDIFKLLDKIKKFLNP